MAKNKKIKNFKIEQDELHAMTIGSFESRKRSSVSIFIIMTLFILVVIFLPEISAYIKDYLDQGKNPDIGQGTVIKPLNPDGDDTEDEETFYEFVNNPSITLDDILFDNFGIDLENNVLNYRVTNNKNTTIRIGEQNYYLEIYNEEKTLLERVKITGTTNMMSASYEDFSKSLSPDVLTNAKEFTLKQILEEEYPPVELTLNENGEQNLVCTKGSEVVTYRFQNNLLKSLESIYSYKRPSEMLDEDYVSYYQDYQRRSSSYEATNGITSTFFMATDGFNVTTEVTLGDASRTYIFNADTFSLDTDAKVVVFEEEAQGFTCE